MNIIANPASIHTHTRRTLAHIRTRIYNTYTTHLINRMFMMKFIEFQTTERTECHLMNLISFYSVFESAMSCVQIRRKPNPNFNWILTTNTSNEN